MCITASGVVSLLQLSFRFGCSSYVISSTYLTKFLCSLDVSYNNFTGTVAPELGEMTRLYTIDAMGNQLGGSLPDEMLKMNPNLRLNFSDNL